MSLAETSIRPAALRIQRRLVASTRERRPLTPQQTAARIEAQVLRQRQAYQAVSFSSGINTDPDSQQLTFQFTTADESTWRILVPTDVFNARPISSHQFYLSEFQRELEERQKEGYATLLTDKHVHPDHRDWTYFLWANWKSAQFMLSLPRNRRHVPSANVEVPLPDVDSSADFVGIGGDGGIRVIDFKKQYKGRQVRLQGEGVRDIARNLYQIPLLDTHVETYVGLYYREIDPKTGQEIRILKIRDANIPSRGQKAEIIPSAKSTFTNPHTTTVSAR